MGKAGWLPRNRRKTRKDPLLTANGRKSIGLCLPPGWKVHSRSLRRSIHRETVTPPSIGVHSRLFAVKTRHPRAVGKAEDLTAESAKNWTDRAPQEQTMASLCSLRSMWSHTRHVGLTTKIAKSAENGPAPDGSGNSPVGVSPCQPLIRGHFESVGTTQASNDLSLTCRTTNAIPYHCPRGFTVTADWNLPHPGARDARSWFNRRRMAAGVRNGRAARV